MNDTVKARDLSIGAVVTEPVCTCSAEHYLDALAWIDKLDSNGGPMVHIVFDCGSIMVVPPQRVLKVRGY